MRNVSASLRWLLLLALPFSAHAQTPNVGIGTTAPTQTLDVNGSLRVRALEGSSTRMVTSDANGNMGTAASLYPTDASSAGTAPLASTTTGLNNPLVAISGTLAVVLNRGASSLSLYDLSNPASPVLRGTLTDAVTLANAVEVALSGTTAAVLCNTANSNGGIGLTQLFTLGTGAPALVSTVQPANALSAGNGGLAMSGNRLYTSYDQPGGYGYLYAYDVSTPASPSLLGSGTGAGGCFTPQSLAVAGNFLAVGSMYGGVGIVNVSNPAALIVAGTTGCPGYTANDQPVALTTTTLVTINIGAGTLLTYSLSSGGVPTLRSSFATASNPVSVAISGSLAYVACRVSGANVLQIVDVSGSTAVLRGTLSLDATTNNVATTGTLIAVANGAAANDLQVFNAGRVLTVAPDGSLSSNPSPGGSDFIQNQTSSSQTGGFRVSGAGTVGGLLTGTGGATVSGGAVSLNTTGSNNVTIGNTSGSGIVYVYGNTSIGDISHATLLYGNTISLSATTNVTGTANINTNGGGTTNIGTGSSGAVNIGNSNLLNLAGSSINLNGTTNINGSGSATTTIGSGTGTTNINTGTSSGATNIGTGSSAGAVTIGRSGGSVTIPRFTTAGLVTTTAAGVLNSSSSGSANGLFWGLSGNSGTSPGTSFIGTTDAQDVVFKANGIERMRLKQNGALSLSVGGAGGNTFVGENTGQNVVVASAYNNTFLGTGAGLSTTTGVNNTYVGTVAGRYATNANNNTVVGAGAGQAMSQSGSGGSGNSILGASAGSTIDAGADNTLMGRNAGRSIVGNSGNSYFGAGTGELSNGLNNTFIGNSTGASMLSGSQNVFLGAYAGRWELGSGNTFIGYSASSPSGTGTNNTLLGNNATISAGLSNATAIGNGASVTASNALVLGSGANVGIVTSAPGYKLEVIGDINASGSVRAGGVALTSDRRLKRNITLSAYGLSTVLGLRPVQYEKKASLQSTAYDRREIGFIAQDVQLLLPTLVSEGADAGHPLAVNYIELIPVLTKAIQEQQAQIEVLKAQNAALQTQAGQAAADHASLLTLQSQLARLLGQIQEGGAPPAGPQAHK